MIQEMVNGIFIEYEPQGLFNHWVVGGVYSNNLMITQE